MTTVSHLGVTVTIHPSGGSDGAVVVQIDTPEFEPWESPGLRVLVNDDNAYVGVAYKPADEGQGDDDASA